MFLHPKYFLQILCTLFEPKDKYFFQNTFNEDHQHVDTQSKVSIEEIHK